MREDKFGAAYHRQYYVKRRQAVIGYLGGKCVACGAVDDLQVDHIERQIKSFNIAKRLSVKNNKAELDKCQLLCRGCHADKTARENRDFTHGTIYGFMKVRCSCDLCVIAKSAWNNARSERRKLERAGSIPAFGTKLF